MSAPWVNPFIFSDGYTVTGADLNSFLYYNLLFLYSPPQCKYWRNSSLGIANSSWTTANIGGGATMVYDNAGFGSPGNPLTIPIAGAYSINWCLEFAASTAGTTRGGRINVNNGAQFLGRNETGPGASGNTRYVSGSVNDNFNAGDQIILEAYQDSGGTLNISADSSASNPDAGSIAICWTGAGT